MRYYFSILLLSTIACHSTPPSDGSSKEEQDPDQAAVLTAVQNFLTAGDEQSTDQLETVLHPSFRILINQFKGGPDVTLIDRTTYLNMIAAKQLGGDPRSSETLSVEIVGNLAFVRAKVQNSVLQFDTLYTLILDTNGKWWLAAEAPFVTSI